MDFYIRIVQDGSRIGWLLGKKQSQKEPTRWEYFFLTEAVLQPNNKIREMCQQAVHEFKPTRDEESMLNLLKACAEYKDKNPDCLQIPLNLVYKNIEDYTRVIPRFFGRTHGCLELREFFGNYDVFKENVLCKPPGRNHILVKAKELKTENLPFVLNEQIKYLQPITHVLKIGPKYKETPCWFRKTGPVACDFDGDRVYRRQNLLQELDNLIRNNAVSMIEGIGATGKTVLVLNWAYDSYKKLNIYYFDIAKYRDFDQSKLVDDIRKTGGFYIIENIHLKPDRIQWVYEEFRHDDKRHILFTSRPTHNEFQARYSEDLSQIEKMALQPLTNADKLVRHYCSHPETPEKAFEEIKQFGLVDKCSGNLWLLAYALRGCSNVSNEGDLNSRIGKEIAKDLKELERINASFPQVLVALSPLYCDEVLTAEDYLANKFGFDYEVLNKLVQTGEITRQETEAGDVFYGLPHSALADLYWQHGLKYRKRIKLLSYINFLYDYLVSDTPNGLEPLRRVDGELSSQVYERVRAEKLEARVINANQSLGNISFFLREAFKDGIFTMPVLEKLAERFLQSDDLVSIGGCILTVFGLNKESGEKLWNLLGPGWLVEKINSSDDSLDICRCVASFLSSNKELGDKLWESMDRNKLARRLSETDSILNIGLSLFELWLVDRITLKDLGNRLDIPRIAEKVNHSTDFRNIGWCVRSVLDASTKSNSELWPLLDLAGLGQKLSHSEDIEGVALCVSKFFHPGKKIGKELWSHIDLKSFSEMLNTAGIVRLTKCLDVFSRDTMEIAKQTAELLDIDRITNKLESTENAFVISSCLWKIEHLSQVKAKTIWSSLDKKELARKLESMTNINREYEALAGFSFAFREDSKCLFELLDLERWASRINSVSIDPSLVLERFYMADEHLSRNLLSLLNWPELGRNLSFAECGIIANTISSIAFIDKKAARKLIKELQLDEVAERLRETRIDSDYKKCLKTINEIDSKFAQKLLQLLKEKTDEK